MFVRHPLIATAAPLGALGLAAPEAAHASAHVVAHEAAVGVLTLSTGRLGAIVAAVLGLVGAAIGARALSRSGRGPGTGNRLGGTVAGMVLGLVGVVLGGLVAATSSGGLGTGNGLGGAIVAMMLGLAGVVLGGLARTRSRRTG
ncbi:DUF6223 family protein [Goodfellowiella coeruleoviolacea]|uniref:Uncharacterized protein n=1 Tax=Goodfellowiella coeruleoviolacea TaxID=334858 RepID=A0AAE3KG02_9PSEU|nr:DUF6223 family protein [Goodfellowiella coeruleoviolacea]MCP2164959.1 hypothetical protein [Goodfellowiella coeruleoviolacea]